ncbi:MAG: hypothetical protein ACAI44_11705, partial [Candidatus Sericytochromatia bacterium]
MTAKTMVNTGLHEYQGMDAEKRAKVRQIVEYMIDDALKNANTTQDKGAKPFRELQKLAGTMPPAQWEAFRKILVNEVYMQEGIEGGLEAAIEKANGLTGKEILDIVKKSKTNLNLTPEQIAAIEKMEWHGDIAKCISTFAAIGTGISWVRSIEDIRNKGPEFKSVMEFANKSISLIGATKDIIGAGGLALKYVGAESTAKSFSTLAKTLGEKGLIKFAGPITSAMTAITDGVECYDRIQKEDTTGAWLKGIGSGAGVVAAGAGLVSLLTTSATAASFAGPIGLGAVAVVGACAITYNYVKEGEETGEFRQDLRKLGISSQAEKLEADFQTASEIQVEVSDPEGGTTTQTMHDAQKGFQWAKDKPVADRASLIGSFTDQKIIKIYEQDVISLLFKDAVGKNKDAGGVDDFDRLIERTDMRSVGRKLNPTQLKELIATLQAKPGEAAKQALERLVIGVAAQHEYSLLKNADGTPNDLVKNMPAAVKKEIAEALMTDYTSGTGETLLSRLVIDLPDQQLAELLSRGGPDLVKNLISEIPQADQCKHWSMYR